MPTARITWAIAERSLRLIPRVPSTFFPSLVFPIFLTISFTGAFDGLTELPGFPTDNIFDWFIPMTAIQGCAFAGITTGMGVARDLESGFYDRLLASPATRPALLAGALLAGMLRAFTPLTLMVTIAFIAGATLDGGVVPGLGTLLLAGLGTSVVAGAWALGLALRFKTMSITPLMQTGVFLTIFLSTAQMPLHLITGWLHQVARVNPMTNVLALARVGFLSEVTWASAWPGMMSLAAMVLVLTAFAATGMRKVIP